MVVCLIQKKHNLKYATLEIGMVSDDAEDIVKRCFRRFERMCSAGVDASMFLKLRHFIMFGLKPKPRCCEETKFEIVISSVRFLGRQNYLQHRCVAIASFLFQLGYFQV